MHNTSSPTTLIALLAITILASSVALASPRSTSTSNGLTAGGGPLAIHGYDPVAYFVEGSARRGLAKYSTLHEGAVFRFVDSENLRAFVRSPERYAPAFGGFCAYGVSVGKKFDGDPEVFKIVGGKLYFNLNPEIQATWEKDLDGNIAEAERKWPEIRETPAEAL